MGAFNGQLKSNEIFAALYNMIISQQVFADNIKGTNSQLVDKAKVDGTLFGDTKLFYAADALETAPWGNDAEATNLLALHRPGEPETQAITLDIFRQISLTVDNYLSKRAWGDEGAFGQFNSVMLGWIGDTKKIYDSTIYNTFIGNAKSTTGKQFIKLDLAGARENASTEEEANRLEGVTLAQFIADLIVEMTDVNRDFNDYGFIRSYSEDEIKVIWNAKYVNKITKIDLPTIFHNDNLVKKLGEDKLPARYFGRAIAAGDKGSGKVIGSDGTYDSSKGTIRVLDEMDITLTSNITADAPRRVIVNGKRKNVKAGETIASGSVVHFFAADTIINGLTVKTNGDFEENQVYIEDAKVICKITTKLPPYMSAFEVGTSFFNPKSLTENHYLTFGRNTLEYLKNYPFITIRDEAVS